MYAECVSTLHVLTGAVREFCQQRALKVFKIEVRNAMIISASRRTDIPSYYGQWLLQRLREGYVFIPNPYNKQRYAKANLTREAVDILVFWTKNPLPFLRHLPEIDAMGYPYYFQFTLTPYGRETEKFLPHKNTLVEVFMHLSRTLGKHRMVWRYDPIIIDDRYTLAYHAEKFASMASLLAKHCARCVISFVDSYKNVTSRMGKAPVYYMSKENSIAIAQLFSELAKANNLALYTCSEEIDLEPWGIQHGACIDKALIENILQGKINVARDKNQRSSCLCLESIDIGTYNCCANGCNYCYALTNESCARQNMARHNPTASVLIGELPENALLTERKSVSVLERQMSLPLLFEQPATRSKTIRS